MQGVMHMGRCASVFLYKGFLSRGACFCCACFCCACLEKGEQRGGVHETATRARCCFDLLAQPGGQVWRV